MKTQWLKYQFIASFGLVFVLALGAVMARSTADLSLTVDLNRLHHGLIGALCTVIYNFLEPAFSLTYTLLIAGILAWRRRDYRVGLSYGATVAMAWLPVVAFKELFARPRPDATLLPYPPHVIAGDWSFSSGHVAFVTALMAATWMFTANRTIRLLTPLPILAIAVIVLVDGYHYPTDVLASIVWAVAVVPLAARLACRVGIQLPARFG
ncbi:PAP2 superfamily protein [Corynebacterium kalinowskii]|uniref:PAP2 superfamily protein n=1 Tax=Corynebacterium kalinowskii TaxID=2675216 RepID=A0A6B8VDD2_9CORY|nr:phosphatase PAP2 family protein [Corynebacterium kalinowskii]QGU03232.1 PAP2 superfamily protein [Corynebacterium kalinowskii]